MVFILLGKIHLIILPCREGIYESYWDTITIKKHAITVSLLMFSAVGFAYLIQELNGRKSLD